MLCWGRASSQPSGEPGPISTFLLLRKSGAQRGGRCRGGARVQVCAQDPPAPMCQKPLVSTAAKAPALSSAASVPGEHHVVHARDAAVAAHPANCSRMREVPPPRHHWCFAVCKSIAEPFANPSDVITQTFPDKTGAGLPPLSAPRGTARRGPPKGSGGAGCPGARGRHPTRRLTAFRHIPAPSPSPQLPVTLAPDKGIS